MRSPKTPLKSRTFSMARRIAPAKFLIILKGCWSKGFGPACYPSLSCFSHLPVLPQRSDVQQSKPVANLRSIDCEIARSIRECPDSIDLETKWGKGSPYSAYIEFSTSHYFRTPPEISAKYDRLYPGARVEAASHLKAWKFRYEFDLG
jgi:hypothetical protein